jgi:hypothetical protein
MRAICDCQDQHGLIEPPTTRDAIARSLNQTMLGAEWFERVSRVDFHQDRA